MVRGNAAVEKGRAIRCAAKLIARLTRLSEKGARFALKRTK